MALKMERVRYPRTRLWRAGVEYYSTGRVALHGGTYITTGIGSTPTKARLDLLFQQGRRRFPPCP